jgi:hypothetical protein
MLPYQFDEQPVRVVLIGDDPWWVASDIARVLGYSHTPHMLRIMDDDEKGVHNLDTPGGEQQLTIISESGLFAAILKSRKVEAQRFRRWVTGEVLPSLRRHGRYDMHGPNPPELPSPAIEDAELPRLTAAIGIMREARQIWGREECRRIWIRIGLPAPITEAEVLGSDLVQKVEAATRDAEPFQTFELIGRLGLPPDRKHSSEVSAALRLLGWSNKRARVQGVPRYVWHRDVNPANSAECA